jgi:flagellar hook-basal body complex protein FliE
MPDRRWAGSSIFGPEETVMANIDPILNFGPPKEIQITPSQETPARVQDPSSFGDMFSSFLKDVNTMQNRADTSIQKMVTGEIKDVHQVMLAVGEAKVAFNLLLEIRNKTMEAYQEVMRMRG